MSLNADQILHTISGAAQGAFGEGWAAVRDYAPAEFRKMAVQLESISHNLEAHALDPSQGYPVATARVLFRMQLRSMESVLVAVTQLTLLAVEQAMNAIVDSLRQAFGGVLAGVL